MPKITWLAFALILQFPLLSQTTLSGIINAYARVESIDTCGRLQVSNTQGFTPGSSVIIIQVKGATARLTESSAFGELSQLGQAGKYERNRIESVTGNVVTLTYRLINSYDPSASVQLVSLPTYEGARVSATLRARPWDGATGGVIALEVRGSLSLGADIDASATGLRGGASEVIEETRCDNPFQRNPDDYGVSRESWRGAPKGEAIASAGDKPNGRGALANGGGGGNDHNSGGGGGANVTAGGAGGENRQPGFGCDGPNPGLGGRALPAQADRLYFGGGGGGGHENNMVGTAGGQGGGIVILLTDTIAANGFAIRANGQTALNTSGDGAGGGGGGGTIVLDAAVIQGNLLLQAGGGSGGSIDNRREERCIGPGGGGSGGRILRRRGLAPTVDVAGGAAGQSTNSIAAGCSGTNCAQPGAAGVVADLDSLIAGRQTGGAVIAIARQPQELKACTGAAAKLTVEASGAALRYQWQISRNGNDFADLPADNTFQGVKSPELAISRVDQTLKDVRFRLRINSACSGELLSSPIPVILSPLPEAAFTFVQKGLEVVFSSQVSGADRLLWNFGDNTTSTEPNPTHRFSGDGSLTVSLIAFNSCGSDTSTQTLTLSTLPAADFTASPTQGCPNMEVRFQSQSSANTTSLRWRFPGGTPSSSTLANPVIKYAAAGTYEVELIAANSQGQDTVRQAGFIIVRELPRAAFTAVINNLSVAFSNTSQNALSYEWSFGDGMSSTEASPRHTYARSGQYLVKLVVTGPCGRDSSQQLLQAGLPLAANFKLDRGRGCVPHTVQFTSTSTGDPSGFDWRFPGGSPSSSTEPNPQVTYRQPGDYEVSLTVSRDGATSIIRRDSVIKVRSYPEVDFSFEMTGEGEVAFKNLSDGAERYTWNFGDGATSKDIDPVHIYDSSGIYEVTLNAISGNCASAANQTIIILLTSTDAGPIPTGFRLFPNPTGGLLNLHSESAALWPLTCRLFNAAGQMIRQELLNSPGILDLSDIPSGMYLLHLEGKPGAWVMQVAVVR